MQQSQPYLLSDLQGFSYSFKHLCFNHRMFQSMVQLCSWIHQLVWITNSGPLVKKRHPHAEHQINPWEKGENKVSQQKEQCGGSLSTVENNCTMVRRGQHKPDWVEVQNIGRRVWTARAAPKGMCQIASLSPAWWGKLPSRLRPVNAKYRHKTHNPTALSLALSSQKPMGH